MAEGGSQHVAGVREGDILAGKYRIERILGVGGMAMVVAAHRMDLDQWVAIKFLLPEMLTNPDVVARFAREARAAVRIRERARRSRLRCRNPRNRRALHRHGVPPRDRLRECRSSNAEPCLSRRPLTFSFRRAWRSRRRTA